MRVNIIDAMFVFGIIVVFALVLFLGSNAHCAQVPVVVRIAQGEIGKGEQGGDNRGRQVKVYTQGKEVAWCAGFVSYVLSRSGKKQPYFLSAKSFWKNFAEYRVRVPAAGDIIVIDRGGKKGHVGIVEQVRGGYIVTIEGNVGRYPAVVRRVTYRIGHIKNLLGFVRV